MRPRSGYFTFSASCTIGHLLMLSAGSTTCGTWSVILLNLGWALLAAWMLCLWARMAPRRASDRRVQLIALSVVILILLPAISMTDDLVAAQNPAEIDCCARRHDHGNGANPISTAIAALPMPAFDGLSIGIARMAAPGNLSSPFVEHPNLASIQNRPPPAA